MRTITLNLEGRASRSCEIHIGSEILDRMGMIIAMQRWAGRYFLVTDENVEALHGAKVRAALEKAGLSVETLAVAAGEASKGIPTLLSLTDRLTRLGADRTSALIALGGGVVGDLAGFAAAIYMRGIPVIQVPTTLLAQVDSGIGGKTGVDTPAGKNLLGAFHQPRAVFIDVAFLSVLPEEQLHSGLAEVIKYGAIDAPELLDEIEAAAARGGLRDPAFLEQVVTAACRIKKRFVESDERDGGIRRILNFGHTIGHAVEASSAYRLSHGQAVAIGMTAAARLSAKLHGLPAADASRLEALLQACGLPVRLPAGMDPEEMRARLGADKKRQAGTNHFVLIKKMGMPFLNGGVPEGVLRETLEEMKP